MLFVPPPAAIKSFHDPATQILFHGWLTMVVVDTTGASTTPKQFLVTVNNSASQKFSYTIEGNSAVPFNWWP